MTVLRLTGRMNDHVRVSLLRALVGAALLDAHLTREILVEHLARNALIGDENLSDTPAEYPLDRERRLQLRMVDCPPGDHQLAQEDPVLVLVIVLFSIVDHAAILLGAVRGRFTDRAYIIEGGILTSKNIQNSDGWTNFLK